MVLTVKHIAHRQNNLALFISLKECKSLILFSQMLCFHEYINTHNCPRNVPIYIES